MEAEMNANWTDAFDDQWRRQRRRRWTWLLAICGLALLEIYGVAVAGSWLSQPENVKMLCGYAQR